jgi:hypothetical protein
MSVECVRETTSSSLLNVNYLIISAEEELSVSTNRRCAFSAGTCTFSQACVAAENLFCQRCLENRKREGYFLDTARFFVENRKVSGIQKFTVIRQRTTNCFKIPASMLHLLTLNISFRPDSIRMA